MLSYLQLGEALGDRPDVGLFISKSTRQPAQPTGHRPPSWARRPVHSPRSGRVAAQSTRPDLGAAPSTRNHSDRISRPPFAMARARAAHETSLTAQRAGRPCTAGNVCAVSSIPHVHIGSRACAVGLRARQAADSRACQTTPRCSRTTPRRSRESTQLHFSIAGSGLEHHQPSASSIEPSTPSSARGARPVEHREQGEVRAARVQNKRSRFSRETSWPRSGRLVGQPARSGRVS